MLGDIIQGIGSAVGGWLGYKGAQDANALTKDSMQKGIRWRVADAKAAGVHPIYALGAPTFNPSPINAGEPLGDALANMGQNIGGAVSKMWSPETKLAATAANLTNEGLALDNDIKRAQLRTMLSTPGIPGVPGMSSGIGGPGARPDIITHEGGAFAPDHSNTPNSVTQGEYGDNVADLLGAINFMRDNNMPIFSEGGVFPQRGLNEIAASHADYIKSMARRLILEYGSGLDRFFGRGQTYRKNNVGREYW